MDIEEIAEIVDESAEETVTDTYEEIMELLSEIREIKENINNLEGENSSLKESIEKFKSEMEGVDVLITDVKNDIEINEHRAKAIQEDINESLVRKEKDIEEINNLQRGVKNVKADINKCRTIKNHLIAEFDDIKNDKAIVLKKLRDIEEGLGRISGKKAYKLPYIRGYNTVLKRMSNMFKEAESRMDISFKLLK